MSSNTPEKPKAETEFEKLMAEEKADKLRQDEALKKQKGRSWSRNQKVAGSIVGGVVALLIATIVVYDPFTGALRWGDGQDQVEASNNAPSNYTHKEWYEESENIYPVKLRDWQKETYDPEKPKAFTDDVLNTYKSTDLWSIAQMLPSESSGFTSNLKKVNNEDGTFNPMFSYWTAESFTKDAGLVIERLTNPTFGEWSGGQYQTNLLNTAAIQDIFTTSWIEANSSDVRNYPIFVDWDNNNYGNEELLISGTRWTPTINNITGDFSYDEESLQYSANIVVNLTYTAWQDDKSKTTKQAKLILELVANPNKTQNGSDNRVLVNKATLEVT